MTNKRLQFLADEMIGSDTVGGNRNERRLKVLMNILDVQKFLAHKSNRYFLATILKKVQSFVAYEGRDLFSREDRDVLLEAINTYDTSRVLWAESISETRRVIRGYFE